MFLTENFLLFIFSLENSALNFQHHPGILHNSQCFYLDNICANNIILLYANVIIIKMLVFQYSLKLSHHMFLWGFLFVFSFLFTDGQK